MCYNIMWFSLWVTRYILWTYIYTAINKSVYFLGQMCETQMMEP
jgi:hypothetical protein